MPRISHSGVGDVNSYGITHRADKAKSHNLDYGVFIAGQPRIYIGRQG